jgi:hypothetical protein
LAKCKIISICSATNFSVSAAEAKYKYTIGVWVERFEASVNGTTAREDQGDKKQEGLQENKVIWFFCMHIFPLPAAPAHRWQLPQSVVSAGERTCKQVVL